jgi:hypothetical protein
MMIEFNNTDHNGIKKKGQLQGMVFRLNDSYEIFMGVLCMTLWDLKDL